MICVSLGAESREQVLADMGEAKRAGADLVEVRADYLSRPQDLIDILHHKSLPMLVTVRPQGEGGRWRGTEDDRMALLQAACAEGADYVDVEFKAYRPFPLGAAKLVLSYHDFEKGGAELDRLTPRMAELDPFLLKVAVQARGVMDLVRCVRRQKAMGRPSAVIAMGEFGEALRILYARYGGAMTYASLRGGDETAAGQVRVSELIREYRVRTIDAQTEVYAVLGFPVSHSKGPSLFNAAFHERGVNARYVRIPVEHVEGLRDLVEALELRGMSVTLPHKETVVPRVDVREEAVDKIGAANTIVVRKEGLVASNTDVVGFAEMLHEASVRRWRHGVYGMKALVLGAGGVARAILWGLLRDGARVTVANRTWERARGLADEFRCEAVPWERRAETGPQIVVNATRVGMESDESPYPDDAWKAETIACDAVYTPRDTRFLREAKRAGAEIVDGVRVFLRQADEQFRRFTGRRIPPEVLRRNY